MGVSNLPLDFEKKFVPYNLELKKYPKSRPQKYPSRFWKQFVPYNLELKKYPKSIPKSIPHFLGVGDDFNYEKKFN